MIYETVCQFQFDEERDCMREISLQMIDRNIATFRWKELVEHRQVNSNTIQYSVLKKRVIGNVRRKA